MRTNVMNQKLLQNIFHTILNVNMIVENVTQFKSKT